jgi:hypothetical protein
MERRVEISPAKSTQPDHHFWSLATLKHDSWHVLRRTQFQTDWVLGKAVLNIIKKSAFSSRKFT